MSSESGRRVFISRESPWTDGSLRVVHRTVTDEGFEAGTAAMRAWTGGAGVDTRVLLAEMAYWLTRFGLSVGPCPEGTPRWMRDDAEPEVVA